MASGNAALALTLLLAGVARAEVPCRREQDGRVSCDAEGFKVLTDAVLEARAEAKACREALTSAQGAINEVPPAATCPPPVVAPERNRTLATAGYVAGALSAAALVVAAVVPMPPSASYGLALAGVAGLGGGLVAVIW